MEAIQGMTVMGRGRLIILVLSRFVPGFAAIGALLFIPAGSIAWSRGWLYLGMLAALMLVALAYFLIRDPELLEKRMRMKERRSVQRLYVSLGSCLVLATFVVPGLDWRLGWSTMPPAFAWIGLGLASISYVLFFIVMRFNSYASRLIEIQEGQKVIDTGPYAVLRHPMYSAIAIIYLATPLALGSWWSLIPAFGYLPLLAMRIRDEEAMLKRDLPGYEEYCASHRWRMFPGIW